MKRLIVLVMFVTSAVGAEEYYLVKKASVEKLSNVCDRSDNPFVLQQAINDLVNEIMYKPAEKIQPIEISSGILSKDYEKLVIENEHFRDCSIFKNEDYRYTKYWFLRYKGLITEAEYQSLMGGLDTLKEMERLSEKRKVKP